MTSRSSGFSGDSLFQSLSLLGTLAFHRSYSLHSITVEFAHRFPGSFYLSLGSRNLSESYFFSEGSLCPSDDFLALCRSCLSGDKFTEKAGPSELKKKDLVIV